MSRKLQSSSTRTHSRLFAVAGVGMFLLLWLSPGYSEDDLEKTELVMSPGMSITVTTSGGTITITAVDRLTRSYTWEGATRSAVLIPRRERWYGGFGIYYPGPGDHWEEHNGITRGVLEEGQQHFKTTEEALEWIRSPHWWIRLVYRDDGLLAGWSKTLPRRQLNAEVWQIYVDGKKPERLPGSQNDKIVVAYADDSPQASLPAAIRQNDLGAVRALLDTGSDPNSKDGAGRPVVFMTIIEGHTSIVQALLDKGAEPNIRSVVDRSTPLLTAVRRGHTDTVRHLIVKGADVEAAEDSGYSKGTTALWLAAFYGEADIAQVLVEAGADLERRNYFGNNALREAVEMDHANVAEVLITGGAIVDSRGSEGMTPLMYAASKGRVEMVKLLISHGADVNARKRWFVFRGASVLDYAKSSRNQEVVELLKQAGAKR